MVALLDNCCDQYVTVSEYDAWPLRTLRHSPFRFDAPVRQVTDERNQRRCSQRARCEVRHGNKPRNTSKVPRWLSSTTIRFTSGAKRRVPVAGFVKPVTVLDTMREQFTATCPLHPEPHHRINRTNQQSPGSPTSNHQKKHSHSASLRDATPHPPHQVTDTNPRTDTDTNPATHQAPHGN